MDGSRYISAEDWSGCWRVESSQAWADWGWMWVGQRWGSHDQLNVIEVSSRDTYTWRFTYTGFGQLTPYPPSPPTPPKIPTHPSLSNDPFTSASPPSQLQIKLFFSLFFFFLWNRPIQWCSKVPLFQPNLLLSTCFCSGAPYLFQKPSFSTFSPHIHLQDLPTPGPYLLNVENKEWLQPSLIFPLIGFSSFF